jgi:NADP-dependent 3-hydroxy acid dehydrogenase YdfG
MERGTAVVTGASSGIGEAAAHALIREGFSVVVGARRTDRLETLCAELGPNASFGELDVTDPYSVAAFCADITECHLLVNNAGGALGLESIAEANEAHWTEMYESNVLGVLRMTRALLPQLIASGDGQVITIGSIAGIEPYQGGAGYNAAKFAVRAVMDVLRLELLGQPVRVSKIDPGMTETEFSLVRFDGDAERADAVYTGVTPLVAADVAECIAFVATRPSHVDIDELVVRPRDQARAWHVNRRTGS